jgi:hypothetical protein
MDTARRSPVCLDLMVGLPMVREPSPARGTGMGNKPGIASPACGRAASMTNDEVRTRRLIDRSITPRCNCISCFATIVVLI